MNALYTIRIYVSSTFSDMHAEREILMSHVFPQLHERCQENNIQMEECDLRFRSEKDVISSEVCFQEMSHCHVFLGLLGEHYGYVPPEKEISITEEEILYALGDGSPLKEHSVFYFRHPKGSLQVPLEDWSDYWEDDDTERFRKLKALKHKIRSSGVPVLDYYGYWNEEECPPWSPSRQGFFHRLENFAQKVLESLWQQIQKITEVAPRQMPQEKPSFSMEEAIALRSKIFVGREEYLESMLQFCLETGSGYYMLHGVHGVGKSALMAKFYEEFSKTIQDQENPPLILKHFVGGIPGSYSVVSILDSFCLALMKSGAVCEKYSADYETLQEVFPDLLEQVAIQRKVVIALDGLNELQGLHNALEFYWLPKLLPENVKVIVSFLSGTEEQNFKKRFRCKESEVLPLRREESALFIKAYLQQAEKVISEESIQLLLSKKESNNPLYLYFAIEECKVLGGQDRILQIKDLVPGFSENIHGMLVSSFLRMEREFGPKIMQTILSNIALSRNGIKKQQLQRFLEQDSGNFPKAFYAKLLQSLKPYLLIMGDYISFWHSQIKDSVFGQYMLLEEAKISAHADLAAFYQKEGYRCRETLLELPYHLYQANEWEKLLKLLTNLEFLETKAQNNMVVELCEDFEMVLIKGSSFPQEIHFDWTEGAGKGQKVATENFPLVSCDTKEFSLLTSREDMPKCIIDKNILHLIFKALNLELRFILKKPQCFFESLWNRCYWHDSPKASLHYEIQSQQDKRKLPWLSKNSKIYALMEQWRIEKEANPEFIWLKSLKPVVPPLDSPLAKVFRGHLGVNHVAYSKDGKKIVSASLDNTARIWDIETGTCLQVLKGHTQWVESVVFSPNGQEVVTASRDKTIRMWDIESGKCVKTFRGHLNWVRSVSYSPEGRRIASGSFDETIRVWDTGTGDCLKVIKGHEGPVHCVVFTKDGKRIASSSRDNSIRLWEWESGKCLKIMKGHTNWIESIAFSPDDTQIVSGSDDNTIRIWNAVPADSVATSLGNWFKEAGSLFKASADCIKVLQGHENKVNSVCFSPDGSKILSASCDKSIKIWNTESGENTRTLLGHEDYINSAVFSPCGKFLVSASQDKTICLWDLQGDIPAISLKEHHDTVLDFSFCRNKKLLASASQDKTIRLWDLETGICSKVLKGHDDSITGVAFSPISDNLLASCSMDKSIRFWDVEKGQCIKVLNAHQEGINHIAFSPDGKYVACSSQDKTITCWNVQEYSRTKVLEGASDSCHLVMFSPEGKFLVSAGEEKKIYLWDLASGKIIQTWEGHSSIPYQILFCAQNTNLVSISQDEIKIWNTKTSKCVETLSKENFPKLACLPKGLYPISQALESKIFLVDDLSPEESKIKSIAASKEEWIKAQVVFPYIASLEKTSKSYISLSKIQGNSLSV